MNEILTISFMIGSNLLGATGGYLIKKGAVKIHLKKVKDLLKLIEIRIISGIICYGCATVIFLLLLKTEDLSFLFPLTAMTYIFVSLAGIIFLKEKMSSAKWIGLALIVLGIVAIAL